MSEGTVSANGIRIWHETFGDPAHPALLLICGLGGQAISMDEELCRRLAEGGRHVIRFDNRDVGLSQWFDEAEPYTLEDMADDAAGLLDALGIGKAHIVGVSMGGMIAQLISIRHPGVVLSLTSIMSTTGEPTPEPPSQEALAVLTTPPGESRDERIEAGVRASRALSGHRYPFEEERVRRRVALGVDRAWHPAGVMRQLAAIVQAPPRAEALGGVTAPTLVIHGTADPLVPYEAGVRTAQAVPGAALHSIEGMGHELPRASWDEIVGLILEHTQGRVPSA
jgi:pimeloyl-ACP methyl ester carboxylesterase